MPCPIFQAFVLFLAASQSPNPDSMTASRSTNRSGSSVAASVCGLLLGAIIASGCRAGPPRVSQRLTAERVRSLSLGMNRSQVESALGFPLRERPGDNEGGVLLDYAIKGLAVHSYALWVYIDQRGRVAAVGAEEERMFGSSYAIYDLRSGGRRYEHPDFERIIRTQR